MSEGPKLQKGSKGFDLCYASDIVIRKAKPAQFLRHSVWLQKSVAEN